MDTPEAGRRAGRPRSRGVDLRVGSVRQARQEAGLSRARLAEPELTRGAIYLIETGRSRPSMPTLQLIAARTGRPLSYFLASPLASESGREAALLSTSLVEAEGLRLAGRLEQAAERCETVLAQAGDA